ncbi:hypothetical protein FOA52_003668 [Chlamydomonas sp. UWO 241]|nr:hypothetical protein FOA52_003668 [Chlamydomonas sp. UWO 241]
MDAVGDFCLQLQRRQVEGAMDCARRTAEVLRQLLTTQKHPDAASLIDDLRAVGLKMQRSNPVELSIGNMVRRVLHLVREEAREEVVEDAGEAAGSHHGQESSPSPSSSAVANRAAPFAQLASFRTVSLSNLLDVGLADLTDMLKQQAHDSANHDQMSMVSEGTEVWGGGKQRKGKAAQWKRKPQIIESINELIDELDNIQQSITIQGVEHIHAKEVILTIGMSLTTLQFLKEASKKRDFQVVVAEGAPTFAGHSMARKLSDAGIQTTLIPDSAVFAMMARANKVLVGAHAVLANGGVVAPVGVSLVSLAAKKHAVPLVVLVGLHKLSPLFPTDPDLTYNDFRSPAAVADFDVMGEAFSSGERGAPAGGALFYSGPPPAPGRSLPDGAKQLSPTVHVPSPAYDYVPPHLISLFVTDLGGHTPSYVYRLLAEFYDRDDYMLSKEIFGGRD